jgi:hypothetical protein
MIVIRVRHPSFCSVIAALRWSPRARWRRVPWACGPAPDFRCRIGPRRGITNRSRGLELLAMCSMGAAAHHHLHPAMVLDITSCSAAVIASR